MPRRPVRTSMLAAACTAFALVGGVSAGGTAFAAQDAGQDSASHDSASQDSASQDSGQASRLDPAGAKPTVAYPHLRLPDGSWARVYSDGVAEVHRADNRVKLVHLPLQGTDGIAGGGAGPAGAGARRLPAEPQIVVDLMHSTGSAYAAGQVVVVYGEGVQAPDTATSAYTSAPRLNRLLAGLGVDRADRLFAGTSTSRLRSMHAQAQDELDRPLLDFSNAYLLHLTAASVPAAVERLRGSAAVAYASPNWTVTTAHTPAAPVRARAAEQARDAAAAPSDTAPGVPDNYALTASAQSMLDRPGNDVVPAFTALAGHGQLPGEGEIITNVSLGDLTDASAAADPDDPCNFYATAYGPTTVVKDGQRYLDWPSMPLIPTYTADSNGVLDPTGEACGQDPTLVEVGVDFSMMAPLPHDRQRPEATGSGLTDLLGIAPGADYRLVIPQAGGAVTDVDAAFLAAANQSPRPSVITASLGFAYDQYGFSGRYLEDDPLTQAVLTAIVHSYGIVVCVAGGDGLRTYTNAAVAPSGGTVPTEVAPPGQETTDVGDVGFSSAPSRDYDSGAIAVGGSTLNDIFSAPPQDPRNADLKAQQAFATTRYNGPRNYSSGVGSRMDVSAPGDNVLGFSHVSGQPAQAVQVNVIGGTSVSAPEVAAAAAVVLQVARLTHDRHLANNPVAVRTFLERTGNQVADVPQTDAPLHIGPQVDVGDAVTTLLARGGWSAEPGVARVAVAQRQQASALGGTITTATDPANISLAGRLRDAWVTIAPDWAGLPGHGVRYRLAATSGPRRVLARTEWARLQPKEILAAAGLPLVADGQRTVSLTYTAVRQHRVLAETTFSLTFGPSDGTVNSAMAPIVDPVVRGPFMRVRYDITGLVGATDPTFVVSHPGRVEPATGLFFRPSYTRALTRPRGTIDVPVRALDGAGIYGVGIQDAPGGSGSRNDSAFAFTRVAPSTDAQPAIPIVTSDGWTEGHYAELPYAGTFQVHFDVRDVAGANGALIEFSAPGPTPFNNYNTFNNPNGSIRDANGYDTGSVAAVQVSGRRGTVTLDGGEIGLDPTMNHVVRVLATHRGRPVGASSGVSTVSMDGVRPTDGGAVYNGFGVSADGGNGFVTSSAGSVQTFDQSSMAVTSTAASEPDHGYITLNGGCPGMFGDHTGLYEDYSASTDDYRTLKPVGPGGETGSWTPPDTFDNVTCLAANQDTAQAALLSGVGGQDPTLQATATDVAANTFGTPVDLTPELDPDALVSAGGIGVDSSTNEAIVPVINALDPSGGGQVVTADLETGEVGSFPMLSTWFPSGVAVDPNTHKAVVPTNDVFGIYDLTDGTGTAMDLGGGSGYQHPAADESRGLFVMEEVAPPDFFGSRPNNNAMSAVVVVDEQGNLVKRVEKFNFYNIYLLNMGSYTQLDTSSSTAYTLGPAGAQLFPFSYLP